VELIKVPAGLLREYLNQLFAEAPIQHLDVVELEQPDRLKPLLDLLGENGHLEKLVSLRLDGQGLDDSSVETLENAAFGRLRWLSLAHNHCHRRPDVAAGENAVSQAAAQIAWDEILFSPRRFPVPHFNHSQDN